MYNEGFWIKEAVGNNNFSYEKRKSMGSDGKIFVTSQKIGRISDLKIGKKIVFEEVDHNGKLQSFCGLENFIISEWRGIPIVFVDNHNHVLRFRYQKGKELKQKRLNIVHIDQHTDMNLMKDELGIINNYGDEDIFGLVNYKLNVGNFIPVAQELGIVRDVKQVNTEYGLKLPSLALPHVEGTRPRIMDIDLDFWAPEMGIVEMEKSFEQVRKLCEGAVLITVATSPFFLEQKRSLDLIKKIFQ